MFQFNSKYIKLTIKIFQTDEMQFAMQYILNLLECVSHDIARFEK